MKVKPYRRCDICNDDYLKVKNCLKIKRSRIVRLYDPHGEMFCMEKVDICPTCSKLMIEWIRTQRWESEEE